MRVYLDTSALLKHYLIEDGSDLVDELWAVATGLATCVATAAEAQAGFGRAIRAGALSADEADRARAAFLGQWGDFIQVGVTGDLAVHAGALAWKHGLRGYDSIHLASSLFLAFATQASLIFATFDRSLWRAAQEEGLEAWPPAWGA